MEYGYTGSPRTEIHFTLYMERKGIMGTAPNYDLHNHTKYCDHAEDDLTLENLVNRAHDLGLSCLGISEHVRTAEEARLYELIRRDQENAETQEGSHLLLVGAEIDPDPIRMDGNLVADIPDADYIILSMHHLPESGMPIWQFRAQALDRDEIEHIGRLWLEWLEVCIENSRFNILGHPLRYPTEFGFFDIRDDRAYLRVFEVFKKLKSKGAGFEINDPNIGLIRQRGYIEAYTSLIRDLKNAGVRFSRGSDAHKLANVGRWEEGASLATSAGLTETDWIDPFAWGRRRTAEA